MKKDKVLLSVLVHYNNAADCIDIIKDLLSIQLNHHHIVVVDNCSVPEQWEYLKHHLSPNQIHFIKNTTNGGYGNGINLGVKSMTHYKPDYIHIINSDTRILDDRYLRQFMGIFDKNSDIGILAPAVQYLDDTLQNTIMPFVTFSNILFFKQRHSLTSHTDPTGTLKKVEVLNGVCLMVRHSVFQTINGFDEDFFMYGEEQDFCYRIHQAGFKCYFYPIVCLLHKEVHHNEQKIINWRYILVRCNQLLYLKKRGHFFVAWLLAILFTASFLILLLKKVPLSGIRIKQVINAFFNPKQFNRNVHT